MEACVDAMVGAQFKAQAAAIDYELHATTIRSKMDAAFQTTTQGVENLLRNAFFLSKEDIALHKLESSVHADVGKGIKFLLTSCIPYI